MRTSQIAAAVLIGVFLVASVLLLLFGPGSAWGYAFAFAVMSIVGTVGLVVLIFYEARRGR